MKLRRWVIQLSLAVACFALGMLVMARVRMPNDHREVIGGQDWDYVAAELIESNASLREEIETLRAQLSVLEAKEGGGAILESLVGEVNHLRIANGLVEVSGPGVEVGISGPVSVLDVHDLINELRNAGSEALALNGHRIVTRSAVGTDGEHITVNGWPVGPPYVMEAVGDTQTLEGALTRPGGLVSLLGQAREGISITVARRAKLTLPVYDQELRFVHALPLD